MLQEKDCRPTNAVKNTSANKIVSMLKETHEYALMVEDKARGKLSPISLPGIPIQNTEQGKLELSMPPYFEELKSFIVSIKNSLQLIEETIDRVDV